MYIYHSVKFPDGNNVLQSLWDFPRRLGEECKERKEEGRVKVK